MKISNVVLGLSIGLICITWNRAQATGDEVHHLLYSCKWNGDPHAQYRTPEPFELNVTYKVPQDADHSGQTPFPIMANVRGLHVQGYNDSGAGDVINFRKSIAAKGDEVLVENNRRVTLNKFAAIPGSTTQVTGFDLPIQQDGDNQNLQASLTIKIRGEAEVVPLRCLVPEPQMSGNNQKVSASKNKRAAVKATVRRELPQTEDPAQ